MPNYGLNICSPVNIRYSQSPLEKGVGGLKRYNQQFFAIYFCENLRAECLLFSSGTSKVNPPAPFAKGEHSVSGIQ